VPTRTTAKGDGHRESPGSISATGHGYGADHRRVSGHTLELFFDVVYVFAFTQVTHLMTAEANPIGILQGLAVFGVLWWSWASYAWLTNQLHARAGHRPARHAGRDRAGDRAGPRNP
jgi:low temperature requirement protein LtrA